MTGLALVSALWARYCLGQREDGSDIAPNDPHWTALQVGAQAAQTRPLAWLEQRRYYGDLAEAPRFAMAFENWLKMIHAQGTQAAIKDYLQ